MSRILLSVSGMSCQHCVQAIEQAVGDLKGTKAVLVDLDKQQVSVSFDEQQLEIKQIVDAIREEGYDVKKKQLVGI